MVVKHWGPAREKERKSRDRGSCAHKDLAAAEEEEEGNRKPFFHLTVTGSGERGGGGEPFLASRPTTRGAHQFSSLQVSLTFLFLSPSLGLLQSKSALNSRSRTSSRLVCQSVLSFFTLGCNTRKRTKHKGKECFRLKPRR